MYDTYVAYVHLSTFHAEFLGPLVVLKGLLQESARLENSSEVEGNLGILWRKGSSDSVPEVSNVPSTADQGWYARTANGGARGRACSRQRQCMRLPSLVT